MNGETMIDFLDQRIAARKEGKQIKPLTLVDAQGLFAKEVPVDFSYEVAVKNIRKLGMI